MLYVRLNLGENKYMLSANERITLRQFQILFVLEAFGTGFVIMPRIAAVYAKQDGWLVVLLFLLVGLFFVTIISGTARSFGNEHFESYTKRLLSAPVSALICVLLWAKILFCTGLELKIFGNIVRSLLLNRTPAVAIYIIILTVASYAAIKGIETRARLAEILIIIISIPLILLGVVAMLNIDFTNLLPMLVTPPTELARGVVRLGFIFTGLEFIWLVFPYLNKPQEGRRAAIQAMAFAGLVMTLITVVTLAKFGFYNTSSTEWPVLKLMDMLNIPGGIIARQGALILSFWMLSVFAFASASLFYGASLLKSKIKRGKHIWWVITCAVIVCIVALIPFTQAQVYWMLNRIFMTFGLVFWVVLPIILIVAKKLRRGTE